MALSLVTTADPYRVRLIDEGRELASRTFNLVANDLDFAAWAAAGEALRKHDDALELAEESAGQYFMVAVHAIFPEYAD